MGWNRTLTYVAQLQGTQAFHYAAPERKRLAKSLWTDQRAGWQVTDDPVLFQYSIDRSSGFSIVVAEDAAQPFLSSDRP